MAINSDYKHRVIRNKVEESQCTVVCLQETKFDSSHRSYIRRFCPRRFDSFAFSPSEGNSGGMIVI